MSANYTRSKCINQGEPGTDIVNSFPDPKDPRRTKGHAPPTGRIIFNMSTVADQPRFRRRFLGHADARLAARHRVPGAQRLAAHAGDHRRLGADGSATSVRLIVTGVDPNLPSDQRTFVAGGTALQWFNMAAFAQNTAGLWGNVPKGYLRGPAFWNADMAFSRNVRISAPSVTLGAPQFT